MAIKPNLNPPNKSSVVLNGKTHLSVSIKSCIISTMTPSKGTILKLIAMLIL